MIRSARSLACATLLSAAVCLGAAPAAHAAFGLTSLDAGLTEPAPSEADQLEAGAHPDLRIKLNFPSTLNGSGERVTDGQVKNINAALPRGVTVNPTVVSTCTQAELANGTDAICPVDSQVGLLAIGNVNTPDFPDTVPLYNMAQPENAPAQIGANILGVVVKLDAQVRTGGDSGISASVRSVSQALPIVSAEVTLWGVPADPVHDAQRGTGGPSNLPRRALVNNPTSCVGALTFTANASSWLAPDVYSTAEDSAQRSGSPFAFTGCSALPFEPSVSVAPTTSAPDSPTGLDVKVSVPQSVNAERRATAHLRDLKLTLPPGMAVNPAAADGLGSCSSAQIAISSPGAPSCPENAKIGSVSLQTPLLAAPLTGSVYLAAQGDNQFGSLLGIYLVVDSQGVVLKLPGRIDAHPATGQLAATFANNPELPFSSLDVRLNNGSRAVLTTPPTCGTKTATAEVTPWSGAATVSRSSSFSIDCTAGLGAFAPTFEAGTLSPTAGQASPLIVNITRGDGQPALDRVSLRLPTGLLAKLRGVRQCAGAQADAGTCDSLSRVGSATVLAGAGPNPFSLPGEVFLTGAYKGAPFGLAVRVRAKAGPLDLGTVVVRQALFIDPEDTHVDVISDPLPTILSGIPIRLRALNVNVDRPSFAVNPTSCAAKNVRGNLGAVGGATASLSVRFQVGGCGSLELAPKLALRLGGSGKALRDGGHPSLKAILTQGGGQSNLKRAEVKLPLSLALDPDNAQTLCEFADGRKATPTCPKGSIVGTAKARTPLLNRTLSGPVYFVKGQRNDPKTKRVIRTLPTLVVPLQGEGVRLNLRARTAVKGGRLVATFDPVPDAPVSRFDLSLNGGGNGILVANSSVCSKSRTLGVGIRGHNGELARSAPTLNASCR